METENKLPLHRHLSVALIVITCILIQALGEETNITLRYDREAIFNHEWWRLITGNLAHLSWSHLWMNLAGLVMIWLIYDRQLKLTWWLLNVFLCSLFVSLGLLTFNAELHWYVGLSGTLHGLIMTGVMINVLNKERLDIILLVIISGKLIWEQISGPLPGSAETAGGPVIVDAHLYGAIAGVVTGLVFGLTKQALRQR